MTGMQEGTGLRGRFSADTAQLMERFNASIGFDQKLLEVDIAGSKVYAHALEQAGVLTVEESASITQGLDAVLGEMRAADFEFTHRFEDIHMAVEQRLTALIGPVGGKLHTGRSRNDQVNLDERLYLREAIRATSLRVRDLQATLIASAEQHAATALPGYTHLQQAQPVLFAHYALSLFWMLERDRGRLADAWKRADCMPLGSGALAGSAFALDRPAMAQALGFGGITPNSLDAVSDRDYLLESLAALSVLMMHLSRYCEDLIIWSTNEFGFVEIDDAYATGSSMMPQKKNPDSLELIRGKTGRVYGNLTALLTTMKGLALTYSKDLQEDKEPVFDSFETVQDCVDVFTRVWGTMTLNEERMRSAIDEGTLATDLADYLVKRGLPFREAHGVVAALVKEAIDAGKSLPSLTVAELQRHCALFEADALALLDVAHSIDLRQIPGGTGSAAVAAQLAQARGAWEALHPLEQVADAGPGG